MSELIGTSETIENVYVYKVPLSGMQLTDFIFHHAFVVFETDGWFWSAEKNTEGLEDSKK